MIDFSVYDKIWLGLKRDDGVSTLFQWQGSPTKDFSVSTSAYHRLEGKAQTCITRLCISKWPLIS